VVVLIRLAGPQDAAAIAAIYRPYVEQSRFTFEEVPPDAAEIASRMASPIYPWLAADEDGRVVGYASTSPMRARAAYRWSVETGIYVRADGQGRGIGRKLLAAHLDLLKRQGFVSAMAGIALPYPESIGLHEVLGYELTGRERGVGFKLGEWVDVGRWQKELAPRGPTPADQLHYAQVWPSSRP
jgi:L-amino acid N-acyltransferase YncA